jgi:hypothetical protein
MCACRAVIWCTCTLCVILFAVSVSIEEERMGKCDLKCVEWKDVHKTSNESDQAISTAPALPLITVLMRDLLRELKVRV